MLRVFTIVFLFIIRYRFLKLKSLSEIIRFRYGNQLLIFIEKYEKHDYGVRNINLNIVFLNSCLDNDLCPAFLRYKLSSKRLQNSESYRRSQHSFLQEEITFKTIVREKIIRGHSKSTFAQDFQVLSPRPPLNPPLVRPCLFSSTRFYSFLFFLFNDSPLDL